MYFNGACIDLAGAVVADDLLFIVPQTSWRALMARQATIVLQNAYGLDQGAAANSNGCAAIGVIRSHCDLRNYERHTRTACSNTPRYRPSFLCRTASRTRKWTSSTRSAGSGDNR